MDQLRRDLGFAIRMLLKHPGLSAIIVITLALGIGMTTTVFSLVNGVAFKGLPFPEGDRIVALGTSDPERNIRFNNLSVHDFAEWREQQSTLVGLAALSTATVNLAGSEGKPERFTGALVTANLFNILRARPSLGRTFQDGDDLPGAEPVIMLGYDVWQDRFGGSPDVIGRTVRANGETRTIVGVAPEGFKFPDNEQLWAPLTIDPNAYERGEGPSYMGIGRLRDDVSLDEARAEFATIARRLEQAYPDTNEGLTAAVMHFPDLVNPAMMAMLYTMLGAVIGVLLIACANVANLLLARASVRTREVAVRSALGAQRGRIISQLMTELLILTAIGGVLGYVLGQAGVGWINSVTTLEPPPYWITFESDHRVVLFVISMVVFSCIISGLVPAFRAVGVDVSEALKDEGRGSSSFRMSRFSAGLVVAEVALSCGLLIMAGLMIKSIAKLRTQDLPFTTENIFTARLRLPDADFPEVRDRVAFYEDLLPKLRAIPGVEAATLSDGLPAAGNGTRFFEIEGQAYAADEDRPFAREGIVTPGYFETFQTPVMDGRAFTIRDRSDAPPVAVVNETFISTFFPDGDPIGRRMRIIVDDSAHAWMTVVGVVPNMKMEGIGNQEGSPAGYYFPVSQSPMGTLVSIAIRARRSPMSITPDVRAAVESLDANLPIYEVLSMEEVIESETWLYWLFGTLFMVTGFVALFLAAVGLYGVMSFAVSRRTQEMGIRMALGADGPSLVRLVMRRGVVQLGIGLTLGIGLAALAATPLQIILYNVNARDLGVFGLVALALAATGLLASFVPAKRVTRVDPVAALTAE
jgi:predicted permease